MRIVCIFLIICCHFGFNSGILVRYFSVDHISNRMMFIQIWSMWGKIVINSFVLVTGYFMCTKTLTVKKLVKLFLEIKF